MTDYGLVLAVGGLALFITALLVFAVTEAAAHLRRRRVRTVEHTFEVGDDE